jgi:hypothetical protein
VSNQWALRPNNMFNLDSAIIEWRRKIISAGIKSPDLLDELESHLREDVGAANARRCNGGAGVSRGRPARGRRRNLNREFAKF